MQLFSRKAFSGTEQVVLKEHSSSGEVEAGRWCVCVCIWALTTLAVFTWTVYLQPDQPL